MLKGYVQDVTGYIHDPELFEVCGAKTKVYQVYAYEDTHRVHIADTSPSYELWFIGGQIIPEKYPLDEERLEWMYDREYEYFQDNPPVEYIYCRDVREPISLGEYYSEFQKTEPEEGEETVSYMDQYAAHMEGVVDYANSNDLKGEVLQKRGIV